MRIALVQTTFDDEDPRLERRLSRVTEQITADLVGREVDLVVLPELWAVGAFRHRTWVERAETLDGPTAAAMAQVARELGTVVHAGSILEEGEGGRHHNTGVVLGPDGRIIATYRKVHLLSEVGREAEILSPGGEVVVADLPLRDGGTLRAGLATCFDLRFPELFRALTNDGATALIVPACWPVPRIAAWETLLRARAMENQAVVVGVNATGTDGKTPMGGRSRVCDAWGEVLHQADETPGIDVVDVDLATIDEARQSLPVLRSQVLGIDRTSLPATRR